MAMKRTSDVSRLDEVDRGMYTTFCSAANSLSQLYTHAMNQQKISFQAGERNSLEKLYNWISRQEENGIRVTSGDILSYLQNELDYGTEDPPPSPRLSFQQQPQTFMQLSHSGHPMSSNAFGPTSIGQGHHRTGISDQSKNSVFSNSLSSPVRRTLQHYHLSLGATLQHYHLSQGAYPANNATRCNDNNCNQTRDTNPQSSNDTSMDIHADSPSHDSPY